MSLTSIHSFRCDYNGCETAGESFGNWEEPTPLPDGWVIVEMTFSLPDDEADSEASTFLLCPKHGEEVESMFRANQKEWAG